VIGPVHVTGIMTTHAGALHLDVVDFRRAAVQLSRVVALLIGELDIEFRVKQFVL